MSVCLWLDLTPKPLNLLLPNLHVTCHLRLYTCAKSYVERFLESTPKSLPKTFKNWLFHFYKKFIQWVWSNFCYKISYVKYCIAKANPSARISLFLKTEIICFFSAKSILTLKWTKHKNHTKFSWTNTYKICI